MLAHFIIVVVVSINSSDSVCQKTKIHCLKIWGVIISGEQQWHLRPCIIVLAISTLSRKAGSSSRRFSITICSQGAMIKVMLWALLSPSGKLDSDKTVVTNNLIVNLPIPNWWPLTCITQFFRVANHSQGPRCLCGHASSPHCKQPRACDLVQLPSPKPAAVENFLGNCQVSSSLEHCQILRAEDLARGTPLASKRWMSLCHKN